MDNEDLAGRYCEAGENIHVSHFVCLFLSLYLVQNLQTLMKVLARMVLHGYLARSTNATKEAGFYGQPVRKLPKHLFDYRGRLDFACDFEYFRVPVLGLCLVDLVVSRLYANKVLLPKIVPNPCVDSIAAKA